MTSTQATEPGPTCPASRRQPPPEPDGNDWCAWRDLLASRLFDTGAGPQGAMTVVTEHGFETTSSSMIALPAPISDLSAEAPDPIWMFAPGRPDLVDFAPVDLRLDR